MGVSRLLAKAWIVTCLFAGAHALYGTLAAGGDLRIVLPQLAVPLGLFAAMGLLFVCGYGVSSHALQARVVAIFKFRRTGRPLQLFNGAVFVVFLALIFGVQVWGVSHRIAGPAIDALERAISFAVPGHAALVGRLQQCDLDGGRAFASAFTWLLAFIFAASAISRLKQTAAAIRADWRAHPQGLTPLGLSAVLGMCAVVGTQCLFVGSPLGLVACDAYAGLPGALLTGLAPMGFAYLVFATLAALLASGSDG